ncbi:MAG: hypothetical protein P4L79_17425 [Legionella sp.]|uniref:hypothetical protein n=1 Tax=Legionella sp. TaxID=459 RepID=UPI00284E4DB9|nr:hypothetical protein [Legionella sp.]
MHTLLTLSATYNPQIGDYVVKREFRVPNGHQGYYYSDHAIRHPFNDEDVILRAESEITTLQHGREQQQRKINASFTHQNQARNTILGFLWDGTRIELTAHRVGQRIISIQYNIFDIYAVIAINLRTKKNNSVHYFGAADNSPRVHIIYYPNKAAMAT